VQRTVAIDLDGTLLNSNRSIGQHSLEMIREATRQGWTIIISTARPVRAIRFVVPEWFEDFYWAACNGAWILKGGRILRRVEVSHEIALYWIDVLSQHRLCFLIEADDKLFTDQQMQDDFIGQCYSLNQLGEGGVCKVLVRPRSWEQVEVVRSLMPAECAYVVTDGGKLVQIAHKECNKLRAVEYILGREGRELDKVIAFGDDNNDIPLVMGAGCGVAMDNATDELKEVADHITVTNDKDGVGEFLRGVLFG
jgi:5-amino-6-(5-phospho-D-ribitylamino)uracil phosphatase